MGKLTLLFALAAVLGGSVLAFSTRALATRTAQRHGEAQADQLARQIAETGRNLAVSAMMGTDGFVAPPSDVRAYDGGTYQVAYAGAPDGRHATLTVTGRLGGATHTLVSEYEFDPFDLPAPVWLDVPYVSVLTSGTPTLSRGTHPRAVAFDRRPFEDLRLNPPLSLTTMQSALDNRLGAGTVQIPARSAWTTEQLLADVNVPDAEGVYQSALAAYSSSLDRSFPGPMTLTNGRSWNGADRITRIRGPLTIASGGSVTGSGVLLVEGDLAVQAGGRLTWSGLVLVRGSGSRLALTFDGPVTVRGGVVVRQDPATPLGHLDVTVWRDRNGLSSPAGRHQVAPWTSYPGSFPWTQHTHRFEQSHVEGRHVYFRENGGAGRHEAAMQFQAALADAGPQDVILQIANESQHGFGHYQLTVQGTGTYSGSVRGGFPSDLRNGTRSHETQPIPAARLRDLSIDLRALSALKRRWDTEGGCVSWPFCIGGSWSRGDALIVRLRRASDRTTLYEAAFYWHMREDEVAAHEAAMQAFRDEVAAGNGFGTTLRVGSSTALYYERPPLLALAERLDWKGNEIRLLSSASRHQTAVEARATPPAR